MDYDLRNQDEYSVPLSELNNLGETPLFALPIAWNELCDELRFQHNRTIFRIALNYYLHTKST
jgi:hypothetical protein